MNCWIPDPNMATDLCDAARAAGDAIMAHYESADGATAFSQKADASPVTAADLASHQVLTARLLRITPNLPVVSEEDASLLHLRLAHDRYWLIDPLDGTKEYLSRNGEFTVNVALIDQHYPVWGCVYAPALGQMYWGSQQDGAFRSIQGLTTALHLKAREPSATLRVIASKSHMDAGTQAFIHRLGPTTLVQAGSSLKFCRIAEGEADIYPRLAPTCEWDTAAAQAVLEAAGGQVTDVQGERIRYGKADILNPYFIASRPGVAWK